MRVVLAGLLCLASGCSLFVMGGKMLFGDPKVTSTFTGMTSIDLTEADKKLLVICTTPESIKSEMPSLDIDLMDGLNRRLKRRGIPVVDSDEVSGWLDDNGWRWDDIGEIADDLACDFIVHVDLENFDYREENSPDMYRGRSAGGIYVYQVQKLDGTRKALEIFHGDFRSEYPQTHPIAAGEMSKRTFQKRYLDHVCDELGRNFYSYRYSDLH